MVFVLLCAGCRPEQVGGVVELDDEVIAKYLEAYGTIAPIYRRAYEAGASPSSIHEREEIQEALEEAGWSWQHYQAVAGSVQNAMLRFENPEAFEEAELGPRDAPDANVAAVERHYYEIKRVHLITQEENYGGTRPGEGEERP